MKTFVPELSGKTGEEGLIEDLTQYALDPLSFVYAAYPWGEGQLRGFDGPDGWAIEVLQEIGLQVRNNAFDGVNPVEPIRIKIVSGHGIGKSAFGPGWICNWIMSTRPHCKGTLTSNSLVQAKTKAWAELRKWFGLSFTSHWFNVKSEIVSHNDYPQWALSLQTSSFENYNSFAGQHAANSTSFYLLDEAANIHQKIWEVLMGGLTDGEPMVFALGNPEINSGYFYNIERGPERKYWYVKRVDSRTVKITNKKEIDKWIDAYGIDSDFVRVRVLGKAPRADDLQCIPEEIVEKAAARSLKPDEYYHAPIILGADPAWQGSDPHVLGKRQGLMFTLLGAWQHLPYETVGFTNVIAKAIREHHSDAEFIDQHGIGGSVFDQLTRLGYEPILCNSQSTETIRKDCANARTSMWLDGRDWLINGGCIPDDEDLKNDLMAPHLFLATSGKHAGKYVLESKKDMKKRGIASPGRAEVLMYTFFQPVVRRRHTIQDIVWDPDKMHGYLRSEREKAAEYNFLDYR